MEWARVPIVILAVIVTFLSLIYIKDNLGMNTSTRDMLSPELPWRQLDLEYERQFTQFTDNILVVIEAATPDQTMDGAKLLYSRLQERTDLFKDIYYPQALSLFQDDALLFLDVDELQDLSDRLAEIQPFLSRLTSDQTLRGLFSMLSDALDALEEGEEIDIAPLVNQINQALFAAINNEAYLLSWHQLMSSGAEKKNLYREFIVLQPTPDFSSLFPARASIAYLQQQAEELNLKDKLSVTMRLTGNAVLAHEEMLSLSKGTEISIALALLVVALIMVVGLGSLRLVLLSLITLIFGLVVTAAFATFAVGELNLISIAFAVLYIGLGVDFAIHYSLRYRELRRAGQENLTAIWEASAATGGSLFLCATTTAIGFFAFIPTDYDGVAELGLISGTGMFISLFVTLTLLPALLGILPQKNFHQKRQGGLPGWIVRLQLFPLTYALPVKIVTLILAVICLLLFTQIRFDHNTLNLQDPRNESVRTYLDLLQESDTTPWNGIVLADGREDAERVIHKLAQQPLVDNVVWLDDFIPVEQDEKLSIIEEMDLLLGGDLPEETIKPPITSEERLHIIQSMSNKLQSQQVPGEQPALQALQRHLNDYLASIANKKASEQEEALIKLEHSLLDALPGRLQALRRSLNAGYVTQENLPAALVERWRSVEDKYLIEIQPRENLMDNDALRKFVEQLLAVEPRMVGTPVIAIEASDAVATAFQQAFSYAFIVIIILLVLLLDNKRDTLYIIIPLIMAAIFTGAASVLFDIPFNFANIIALPLILGIGVDSGIHILHRFRTDLPADQNLLGTSSARAVLVSALTTIGSIGNLAFSSHLGTASMGKLLTIGIIMTLICMLVVLPSLLAPQIKRQ